MRKNPNLGLRRYVPLLKERYGIETTYDKLRYYFRGWLAAERDQLRNRG